MLPWERLGLDGRLMHALKSYKAPTAVQEKVIPAALEGKDVIARARTGSGKTLAYLLPAFQKILKDGKGRAGWQALVLVPTKELCEQVAHEASQLGAHCEISASALVAEGPGVSQRIATAGQLVVSTPGRIAQVLSSGVLSARILQQRLQVLVLDEADLLLSYGHEEDLKAIAPQIPRSCQCLLMSATSSAELEGLQKLVLQNPVTLDLLSVPGGAAGTGAGDGGAGPGPSSLAAAGVAAEIEHFYFECDKDDKLLAVMAALKLGLLAKKVLLFVNSIDAGFRLRLFLEAFGLRAALLNAELPLNSRHHILQEFNRGLFDYLIATDAPHKAGGDDGGDQADAPGPPGNKARRGKKRKAAAAALEHDGEFGVTRGIDFKGVKTVVNFDPPANVSGYVHRVGRTGRAGQSGLALTLLTPGDLELRSEVHAAISGRAGPEPSAEVANEPAGPSSTEAGQSPDDGEGDAHTGLRRFRRLSAAALAGLRYRAEDVARSVTKQAIKEARAKELRLELLNSARLREHFEEHPGDLAVLKHDQPLARAAAAPHLKHIPAYIRDGAFEGRKTSVGGLGRGMLSHKKRRKLAASLDPLRGGGFVRAPKRGGDADEPLTEAEKAAASAKPSAAAKKAAKARQFAPKRNVRKHSSKPKR